MSTRSPSRTCVLCDAPIAENDVPLTDIAVRRHSPVSVETPPNVLVLAACMRCEEDIAAVRMTKLKTGIYLTAERRRI